MRCVSGVPDSSYEKHHPWLFQGHHTSNYIIRSRGSLYHELVNIIRHDMEDDFSRDVHDALKHLYDPGYRPPATLCHLVGCTPQEGVRAVQAAIVRAIGELAPTAEVPADSRAAQVYQLLQTRFVKQYTLERTAEQMNSVSYTHLTLPTIYSV